MAFFQDNLGKLDFTGARDDGVAVAHLDHTQVTCTSLHRDNHASTSPHTID